MQRFFRYAMVAMLILSLVALAGCGAQQAGSGKDGPNVAKIKQRGKLLAGVKSDVPGFGYKNPKTGQFEGYEIEIVKRIAKAILGDENKVEFTHVTPKTRVALLNSGELDLVAATFTVTEERKKEVDFIPVYYTDGIKLLVRKDSGIKGLKDLDGKTIGVTKGATTGPRLKAQAEKLGAKVNFAEFDTYPEILSAMQAGRVQAMSTDGCILKGYEMQDPSTVLLPENYSQEPYGIATKKGNDDMRDLVAKVVTDLDKSGELKKLQEKYGIGSK